MSLLGFVYLIFYVSFFKLTSLRFSLPAAFVDTDFFYDDVAFKTFNRSIDIMDTIYNIFAWIDVFIDLDLIFGLLFLTLLFYGLKFASSLAKRIMGCFK